MLVGERMSHPVIPVHPDTTIPEALDLMRREHIRRAPVMRGGSLVGMVTDRDLLHASASSLTTLSVWELNYQLNKITVAQVMSKAVLTVTEDTPIEEAARIMADNRIGGLPVLRGTHVVGMITETNLFKIFLELMGARERGVRVTALLPEQRGRLTRFIQAIANGSGHIIAFGTFAGEDPTNILVTCKVAGLDLEQVRGLIEPVIERLVDIRIC
jgi:acetoin utilization protein AcuB